MYIKSKNLRSKFFFYFFVLILISVSVTFSAYSQEKVYGVDKTMIDAAMKAKELGFQRRYNDALQVFEKIHADYPESATGLFGQMAIWQIRMFENDDFRFKSKYEELEKAYDNMTIRQLREGEVPAWELFVHGACDGMRGFFKGRQGKWLQALSHGLHAMRMFKQLKFREPGFVDADLGFGMYKFWRSVFTNELKSLPFFSDSRAEGMALVENASRNASYSKDLALANLIFIYGQENQYERAIQVANQLLASYPGNIIVKFQKGRNLLWAKKYADASKIFEDIYKQDPAITKALLQQSLALFNLKEYERSKELLDKYSSLEKQKDYLASAYYWLGRIAEEENNKQEAVDYYNKSLSTHKLKAAEQRLTKLESK